MSKTLTKAYSSPRFRTILGLGISALTIYLSLRHVNLPEVWACIVQADLRYTGLALLLVVINFLAKTTRWKVLLHPAGFRITNFRLMMSLLIGQMLNNIAPARIGEISRVYVIAKMGPEPALIVGTIVVEKVLDMLAYGLLFIALLFLFPLPEWVSGSAYAFALMTLALSILVFFLTYQRRRVLNWIGRVLRWLPKHLQSFLNNQIQVGLVGLEALRNPTDILVLAFETALVWTSAVLVNHYVGLAFGVDLPLAASLLLLISLLVGITLPSVPGRIGVFEYICILALGLFGIKPDLALSYGVTLHAVVFLPILVFGLISYWVLGWNWKKEQRLRNGK